MTSGERPAARPVVAVIGTGGTISTAARRSLDLVEYSDFGRKLEPDELLATFPELSTAAQAEPVSFKAVGSSSFGPADWIELAEKIDQVASSDLEPAGIVITHGTGSLEETAYFLHLTLRIDLPVVMVGAQRPVNGFATDAGGNLLGALRVAGSPAARGLGVLVVLNGEIHSAREVTKTSNWRLETFQSRDAGPLGYVDPDGVVSVYRKPTRRHAPDTSFHVPDPAELPRVDIVYSYSGADGALVEAAVASGAKAIVVAGQAPGRATPRQREALIAASRRGVLVIVSSRAGSGRTIPRSADAEYGFIAADNLNPQKARVLAMLALTQTREPAEVEQLYAEY